MNRIGTNFRVKPTGIFWIFTSISQQNLHFIFPEDSCWLQSTGNQTAISRDKVTKSSDNSDEDDSWDKMFDDDGDCLDPNSLKEVF
jgi:hypothetical protein